MKSASVITAVAVLLSACPKSPDATREPSAQGLEAPAPELESQVGTQSTGNSSGTYHPRFDPVPSVGTSATGAGEVPATNLRPIDGPPPSVLPRAPMVPDGAGPAPSQ